MTYPLLFAVAASGNPTLAWVTTIIVSVFGGGMMVAVVNALAGRRGQRTDSVVRLSSETLKWVDQFQEEAARAHKTAETANEQLGLVRVETEKLRTEVNEITRYVERIVNWIHTPGMSMQRLRQLVDHPERGGARLTSPGGGSGGTLEGPSGVARPNR